MTFNYDLVALVADSGAEWTLRTLLDERHRALQIRRVRHHILRHQQRDAGAYLHGPDLLKIYIRQAHYALVMLDYEGSGREAKMTAEAMEADLEERLETYGWVDSGQKSRAMALVLDPELEVWVWSASPHVPAVLGLDSAEMEQVLRGFTRQANGKPQRPKEAMLAALRAGKKPHSSAIFSELAQKVSLQAHERAFDKLRRTLQAWFPVDNMLE